MVPCAVEKEQGKELQVCTVVRMVTRVVREDLSEVMFEQRLEESEEIRGRENGQEHASHCDASQEFRIARGE